MSWWQHLLGWITGNDSAPTTAVEPQEDADTIFVNLTGKTLHFCRSNGLGKYYVYMSMETQSPVPTLRSVVSESSSSVQTRVGNTEHAIETYTGEADCRRTVIDNLREWKPYVRLIVPEHVFDAAVFDDYDKDRDDLWGIVAIPYTDVDGGTKDNVYCVGVRDRTTYDKEFTSPIT